MPSEPIPAQNDARHRFASVVDDGWTEGASVFSSLLSGTLLGLGADHLFGTEPWLVITGIVFGAYSGFHRVWNYSKKLEEPRER